MLKEKMLFYKVSSINNQVIENRLKPKLKDKQKEDNICKCKMKF